MRRPLAARALWPALLLLGLAAAGGAGAASAAGPAATAAARAQLPGEFVVRGAALARGRRGVAGRTISVYLRPRAVTVDGCRSRSRRVRARRGRASISVVARCLGIRGALRVRGTASGRTLRGTASRGKRTRRFAARLKPPAGVLLRGRRTRSALRALRDTDRLQRHDESEISRARGGARVPRTEIVVRLRPGATVGQVNATLRSVGGRIAGSLDGSTRLIASIPDPGGLDALDAVLARLERRPGIRRADRTEMAAPSELPPDAGAPPSSGRVAELSHLLSMRMPAAWNARAAIRQAERPTVLVADVFGNGRLSQQVDAQFDPGDLTSGRLFLIPPGERGHGYHVTGIIAGNFAGAATPAGRVTGVFPGTTRLELIDAVGSSLDAVATQVLQAVRDIPGRVVVNTSLGHRGGTADNYARREGSDWAHEVLTRGYLGRMLHAGSAGNDAISTTVNSPWAAAAVRTDLLDAEGQLTAPLGNTLAVENVVDSGAPAFTPGCLSLTSNHGGTIAAVGHQVFSNLLGSNAGNLNGTSMASPQVAGLAQYLWSIAPDLTAPQLRSLMIATADPPLGAAGFCGEVSDSAPLLDAYEAVLSLDQAAPVSPAGAPVRLAILDHNASGKFDQADLAAHAAAIAAGNQGRRDWGRSDLNGDGFTGVGATTPVRFDLDRTGSTRAGAPSFGPVTQSIEGASVSFNENQVSDLEVLCYYAYSGIYIYTGSTGQREALLTSDLRGCGHPLTVTPPGATLAPGGSVQFSAKVANVTDGTVAWAATRGAISASGLYTAPSAPGTYVVAATDVTDPTRSATATVTVTAGPTISGTYFGTAQEFDSDGCHGDPCDLDPVAAVVETVGDDFTLDFWYEGTVGSSASCGNGEASVRCIKYTGTISGNSMTGTGVRNPNDPDRRDMPFSATISGNTLTGRASAQKVCDPGDSGCYYEFSVTK